MTFNQAFQEIFVVAMDLFNILKIKKVNYLLKNI